MPRIRFLYSDNWIEPPQGPVVPVRKGDVRDVSPLLAAAVLATGRGVLVPDVPEVTPDVSANKRGRKPAKSR